MGQQDGVRCRCPNGLVQRGKVYQNPFPHREVEVWARCRRKRTQLGYRDVVVNVSLRVPESVHTFWTWRNWEGETFWLMRRFVTKVQTRPQSHSPPRT